MNLPASPSRVELMLVAAGLRQEDVDACITTPGIEARLFALARQAREESPERSNILAEREALRLRRERKGANRG